LHSGKIDQVVSILEDDAFRRGGAVSYDRLLSLCAKLELSPDAVAAVKRRLMERDVGIESDRHASEDDANAADEPEDESASEPVADEPTEGTPPEIVRDMLGAYYQAASHFQRLSADEELALSRRFQIGRAAAKTLSSTESVVDRAALAEFVADGKRARDTLIEASLLLVPHVAKSIEGRDLLPKEDLIQEGNLGLMRAVETFEVGHEARFSTYACWWIWSFMKRALANRGRLVRLPVHFVDRLPLLFKARAALTRERDGVPPSCSELAEHLGWRLEHVVFALQSHDHPQSIDATTGDNTRSLSDRLIAPLDSQPDTAVARSQEQRIIADLVDSLGDRMALVLREHFGLGGMVPKTLEEIGDAMGVTRERVRQIEAKALDRLRHASLRKFWRLFGISSEDMSNTTPKKVEDSDD
jgi:RNA polymerase primary sigma factor